MNTSNRYEIEILARRTQADLEKQLQRWALLQAGQPARTPAAKSVNLRAALIVAGASGFSIALAFGLSYGMAFAIALVR